MNQPHRFSGKEVTAEEEEDLLMLSRSRPSERRIQLVAPLDLNGGYVLDVNVEGSPCSIQVPQRGVSKGEKFIGEMPAIDMDGLEKIREHDHVPLGAWRDGLCDCFAHETCHPSCFLAFVCPALALGQVLTRSGFNTCGSHYMRNGVDFDEDFNGGKPSRWSPFRIILVFTVVVVGFNRLLYMVVLDSLPEWDNSAVSEASTTLLDDDGPLESDISLAAVWGLVLRWLHHGLVAAYILYVYIVTVRTRNHIRQRYAIPSSNCSVLYHVEDLDDCCLSLFCHSCVTAQMLRHTANYRTHGASCCRENGLYDANIV